MAPEHPLQLTLSLFAIVTARYLAVAGAAYWIWWIWRRAAWSHRRVQPEYPEPAVIRGEILWSLSTCLIFALSGAFGIWAWQRGWTRVYLDIGERGWAYFVFSVLAMAFVHETYFYWTHRWMHRPRWFKRIHRVHHLSRNPSPWATFSFHPYEAVIQAAVLPAMVLVIPAHPAALLILLSLMTVCGVVNHLGYEVYPKGSHRHRLGRWWITVTHHHMHHRWVRCNYGLYFTLWDRWLGTHHPDYERAFEEVASRDPAEVSLRGRAGAPAPATE